MEAWVTLSTNDTYALGALVLANSLRRVNTSKQIHCMVTNGVSEGMKGHLAQVFDQVSEVNVLDSNDPENLALLGRPDLGVTFTKLHCWLLTQYQKCVFLDADILVLQNSDELFDYEEFSAAPDIGWPDCFNSGVFVFQPSVDTYRALVQTSLSDGSFDGGDQGLLNAHFHDWRLKGATHRLSFVYNMSSSSVYTYTAAYKRFAKDVKIVHFLGATKPWHMKWAPSGMQGETMHNAAHIHYWWSIFIDDVHPKIDAQFSVLDSMTAMYCGKWLCALGFTPGQLWSPRALFYGRELFKLLRQARRKQSLSLDERKDRGSRRIGSPFCTSEEELLYLGLHDDSVDEELAAFEDEAPASTMAAFGSFSHLPTVNLCTGWIRGGSHETVEAPEQSFDRTMAGLSFAAELQQFSRRRAQQLDAAEEVRKHLGAAAELASASGVRTGFKDFGHFLEAHLQTEVELLGGTSKSQMIGGSSAAVHFAEPKTDADHRRSVEAGKVDYLGRDSWDNIQKRLEKSLNTK